MLIGTEYTATVGGQIVKEVACQPCRAAYFYLLRRQAKGKGSSLYFIDTKGAQE